ncbi:LapA family protein [Bombella sp. ESL0378]|uniref:LapA family protein n=1 Tax=unclassified Bombella TaxID=2644098 RepID=UPI0012D88DDD|nr:MULTISPECIES: LapA family protein [unclassified Bombella]MUG04637.1 LapA family protein [Bombella sp. ESL0378]MUG90177.1 LapA family protein [Bombella sp. ESL0385]
MIRLLIIVLFVAFIAIFSMSNLDATTVWIASFGFSIKMGKLIALLSVPSLILGLLLGAAGDIRQRRRARKAESQLRGAQKQLIELHQRLDQLKPAAASASSAETKHPLPQ